MSPPCAFFVADPNPLVDPELLLRAFVRAGKRAGMESYTLVNEEGGYTLHTSTEVAQPAIVEALREILAEKGASA